MKKRFRISLVSYLIASTIALGFICGSAGIKSEYKDGTWIGTGNGRNGPISVELTIKDNDVLNGKVVSQKESDFAVPAISKILEQVVNRNELSSFDSISGATLTCNGTAEAVRQALAKASGKTEKEKTYKNTSCDIVIIGAGGAGLAAAIEAKHNGADVILLEKMGIAGGNTTSATGGLNAAETRIQKALGIQDSKEQFFQDTMKGGYNKNDEKLVRYMVEKAPETVDWLMSFGVDLSDVGKMAGSTNKRTHRPKGGAAVGAHMIPVMMEEALKSGVDFRNNSKVVDILKNGNKASGVKVEYNGKKYVINAKAVIIATGGFGANPKMIVKYKPELDGFGTTNHHGATGDAFVWIEKFDGVLTQMDEIQTHPTVVPGNGLMITEAVRGNGAIMINRDGKRFCSEMATRDVMSKAILQQTGKTAYLVFDTSVRKSLKAIEGYVKKGLLTEGETPEALAEKLSINPAEFAATIRTYNKYQAEGNDPDYGRKGSEMPRALNQGPYFAVEVGPAIHHTMGGIKINESGEVLNSKNEAVPGLYAAGEVTGGVHGGNRLGGNAVADICVFGKIAADSALNYIK